MNDLSTTFMFTGLGAQYYGMGQDLYRANAIYKSHVDALDAIVSDVTGRSIVDVIFDTERKAGPVLDDPVASSLSTFLIERALTNTMIERGVTPNVALGSSIGMFAASVLAGCFDDEQGVRVIYGIGRALRDSCAKGCMIAVLDALEVYHDSALLSGAAELAGVNFPGAFVISLPQENLPRVEAYLRRTSRTFQTMPVSRAYHSRWIDDAKRSVLDLLATLAPRPPAMPLVCCSKARELRQVTAEDLWSSIRDTLLFQQSIARLEESGAHRYVDLGPSGTMATFLKYGLPSTSRSERFAILSPFGRNASRLEEVVAAVATAAMPRASAPRMGAIA